MSTRSPWFPRLRVYRDFVTGRRYLEVDVPGLPSSRPVTRKLLFGRLRYFRNVPF